MDVILRKAERYIEDNHMLSGGEYVIAGVSGGADSMCLLFVLMNLRKRWNLTLHVVHINHGIRGVSADKDQKFVENFCREHGLLWTSFYEDIPAMAKREHLSCEEAGRIFRYRCFEQVRQDAGEKGRIAVAHNKNDAAETLLFNLFRGSGIRGLGSIAPVNDFIIRPILCLERQEIEVLLAQNGLSFCTDETNLGNEYTRNRLRNDVLPYVTEHINANAAGNLWRMAQMARDMTAYVEKQRDLLWPAVLCEDGSLDADILRQQDTVMIQEIIRKKIGECTGRFKDISQTHIEQTAKLLEKPAGKRVNLPYGLVVERGYRTLVFKGEEKSGRRMNQALSGAGAALEIPLHNGAPLQQCVPGFSGIFEITLKNYEENQRIEQKQYTKWLDYDKIKDGLMLRHRCSGDYMVVDGHGSRKLLRRILIDGKVPRSVRDDLFLIADGDHIAWIIGGRISDAYKVTPKTKKIIEIKVKGDEYNGR